jgi:hypothetical protein
VCLIFTCSAAISATGAAPHRQAQRHQFDAAKLATMLEAAIEAGADDYNRARPRRLPIQISCIRWRRRSRRLRRAAQRADYGGKTEVPIDEETGQKLCA